MSGGSDLATLLATMEPLLDAATYLFIALPAGVSPPPALRPCMTFVEDEGLTLIVSEEDAAGRHADGTYPCRRITLHVHSSLTAVGFLAIITARLAQAGISVNAVSAFHHDHLFVPVERANEALRLLQELSAEAR